MGVAHHGAYVPWLEIGRTELLRAGGTAYAQVERGGVLLMVVALGVRYRRPALYDDLLEVRTDVVGGGRVKIEHAYELVLVEDGAGGARGERPPGQVLATGTTTLACVRRDGRPAPLPDWLVLGAATRDAGPEAGSNEAAGRPRRV